MFIPRMDAPEWELGVSEWSGKAVAGSAWVPRSSYCLTIPTIRVPGPCVSLLQLFNPCAVRARQLMRVNRPGTQESDTRRMVQFLNPWDWLNAQVRGLVLAASAWASLRGAGVILSLLHFYSGVGGGFRWKLPLALLHSKVSK